MRKLGLQDVFALSEILDVMDVKLDISSIVNESKESTDQVSYVGGQIVMTLIRNLYKADKQVYKWLASLTGKTIEEVKDLSFKELKIVLTQVIENEDIVDFFDSFSQTELT